MRYQNYVVFFKFFNYIEFENILKARAFLNDDKN